MSQIVLELEKPAESETQKPPQEPHKPKSSPVLRKGWKPLGPRPPKIQEPLEDVETHIKRTPRELLEGYWEAQASRVDMRRIIRSLGYSELQMDAMSSLEMRRLVEQTKE